MVQPETVIGWHRQGFRLWWRWKSWTKRVGRHKLDIEPGQELTPAEEGQGIHVSFNEKFAWRRRAERYNSALP